MSDYYWPYFPRTHAILVGDVIEQLRTLPDESVQCVGTSGPYFGLRKYGKDPRELGQEKLHDCRTHDCGECFVCHYCLVFDEVRRVLRKDGTCFMNLGDSYAGGKSRGGGPWNASAKQLSNRGTKDFMGMETGLGPGTVPPGLKRKDLCGIPWRVALALQERGWWLRNDIIWNKPNGMCESVRDRFTMNHEYVFMLTKSEKYFFDADAVREACVTEEKRTERIVYDGKSEGTSTFMPPNPAGRNKRTVWTVATASFPGSHFAVFPEALVEPCIKAGTSEKGCCPKCGEAFERVVEKERYEPEVVCVGVRDVDESRGDKTRKLDGKSEGWREASKHRTVGWRPTCTCPERRDGPVPCVVLDPFLGSGTTLVVARRLGRHGIGIELNEDYVNKIAEPRIRKAVWRGAVEPESLLPT